VAGAYALWRRRPPVFYATVLAVLLAEVTSMILQAAIGRDRPFVVDPRPPPLVHRPDSFSLPSGHATVAFACATVLGAAVPRLAAPLFVLAAAVAWSRVVVGVHYPLDVLAGAGLGVALGLVVVRALRWLPGGLRRSGRPPPRG
jgi:undecaprenyl-diphosphatase